MIIDPSEKFESTIPVGDWQVNGTIISIDDLLKENLKQKELIDKIKKWFEEHKNQTVNIDGMTVKETHIYDEILNLIKEYEDETKRV